MKGLEFLILGLAFALDTRAEAKTLEVFATHIQLDSLGKRIGDLRCRASAQASYVENLIDEKGKGITTLREVPASDAVDGLLQRLERPKATSARLLNYIVEDQCTREATPQYYAKMRWKCQIADPAPSSPQSPVCIPAGTPEIQGSSNYNNEVIEHFKSQNPQLRIKYEGLHEEYAFDNCGENSSRRKVIHIKQGVRGNPFEDEFNFFVTVNGKRLMKNGRPLRLESKDGLIDEEISYCARANENVEQLLVKVEATAKGKLWNARYRDQNTARLDSASGRCEDQIILKRFNPLGEWWLATYNQISVGIQPSRANANSGTKCMEGAVASNLVKEARSLEIDRAPSSESKAAAGR